MSESKQLQVIKNSDGSYLASFPRELQGKISDMEYQEVVSYINSTLLDEEKRFRNFMCVIFVPIVLFWLFSILSFIGNFYNFTWSLFLFVISTSLLIGIPICFSKSVEIQQVDRRQAINQFLENKGNDKVKFRYKRVFEINSSSKDYSLEVSYF